MTDTISPPLLFELDNVTVSFPFARGPRETSRELRPALHHLDFKIFAGEMWNLRGPNGSGKSTLLRLLAGEIPSWEGRFVRNVAIPRIGYLGQHPLLDQDLPVTVFDVVSQGIMTKLSWGLLRSRQQKQAQQDIVTAALMAVDLVAESHQIWSHLSGGQRQRALIARLLAQDADVLLLDEPTNSLDQPSQEHLAEVLTNLHAIGKTIVCAVHLENWIPEGRVKGLGPQPCREDLT